MRLASHNVHKGQQAPQVCPFVVLKCPLQQKVTPEQAKKEREDEIPKSTPRKLKKTFVEQRCALIFT
jgi:hypothetical protein